MATGQDIPTEWSLSKNLAWKISVPGSGWSQPVERKGKLFVTSAVGDKELKPKDFAGGVRMPQSMGMGGMAAAPKMNIQWRLHCIDAITGETDWSTTVCEGQPKFPVHPSNTYATESPIVTDEGVVAFFGATGTVAGVALDGAILWKQELGVYPTSNGFGTGSSVATIGGLAFVQHFTEGSSLLVAFDCKTGTKTWSHERDRKGSSWSSPIIWTNTERTELVCSGGERIESFDPKTGRLLWSLTNVKAPTACSIAFDRDRIYFGGSDPMSKGPLFAVRAGAKGELKPDKKNESFEYCDWLEKRAAPGMASPLSSSQFVFVTDNNVLRVYEAKTGKKVQEKRIEGLSTIASSPILIDDKLLMLDEKGNGVLISADADCKIIGSGEIQDTFWSTAAVGNNSLYLRGVDFLYCIRKTGSSDSSNQ